MAQHLLTIREIRDGLKRPGKSQRGLARALGIADSAVHNLLKGTRRLQREEERIVRKYLGIAETDERMVPVVGFVGANAGEVYYGLGADSPADMIPAVPNATAETVAVEIKGNSLGAAFDGGFAYYNDRREPVTPDLIGRNTPCVVGLDDGRVLIKILRRASGHRYDLLPGAGVGETIHKAKVVWAARVTHVIPKP